MASGFVVHGPVMDFTKMDAVSGILRDVGFHQCHAHINFSDLQDLGLMLQPK